MGEDIQIVDIAENHIEGFHRCLDQVAKEGMYLAFSEAPSLENVTEFVRGNIRNNEIQLVAVSEAEVVGWIDILRGKLKTNQHCGRLGMGILQGWRGKGLGKRLLKVALEKATQSDLRVVQLDVFETNQRAISLYEQCGFKRGGLRVGAQFVNGKYISDIPMAKSLIDQE